ncbi:hypothetical protein B0I00_1590 [Novosphingobium kunmingense]|uniref:Uncharacterized protein n=1 Tax=Novosphingobium kunmingense TaxID=1211806 RepID=A0A2N0HKD4_9SPHN|nr:hypothetical protein [Novosphingobium kunmingense]PKB19359.1 hypothetical protein B0I00_1590 [Novosphingobium kunmingense]
MSEEKPQTPRISRERFIALMQMADEMIAADLTFRIFTKLAAERASLRERGIDPDVVARR